MPRQILVLLMIYLFRESSPSLLQQTSPSTSSFKSSAASKWWELFKNSCLSVEPCSSELGQIDKAFWSIVGKHFFGGLDSIKTIKSISSTIQFAKFISRLKVRNILIPKKADENGEKNEFSVNDELTFDGWTSLTFWRVTVINIPSVSAM